MISQVNLTGQTEPKSAKTKYKGQPAPTKKKIKKLFMYIKFQYCCKIQMISKVNVTRKIVQKKRKN